MIGATHLALLRGINVGGKNKLPMNDLAELFVEAGCKDVRTYIQSGNVIFNASRAVYPASPDRITALIAERFGYRTPVILRTDGTTSGSHPQVIRFSRPRVRLRKHFTSCSSRARRHRTTSPRSIRIDRRRDAFVVRGAGGLSALSQERGEPEAHECLLRLEARNHRAPAGTGGRSPSCSS